MIIFSRRPAEASSSAKIIGEVKCSQVLYDDIRKNGGCRSCGRPAFLIKGKMKEEGALLAGEMSGHLFFAERYFGYEMRFTRASAARILTAEIRNSKTSLPVSPPW